MSAAAKRDYFRPARPLIYGSPANRKVACLRRNACYGSAVVYAWSWVESSINEGNRALYSLTRIYCVEYIKRVESVFDIIAEPNRRAILSLLVSSQQSVGEIERQLRMPQPTVSKHLRVLRDAGFVESTVDAQRRLYRLKPEPLREVDAWLAPFRRFWSAHVDALERHLDRMEQSTPPKKETRSRR
jgi:DNA-binding transcriptional ArsR family regulator